MSKSKYTLGLDLGIASIGWAVYETTKMINKTNIPSNSSSIIDCGIRIFDAAENPKDKSSLSADRRNARGMRRTIRRKAYRLSCVRKQLVESGLISTIELQNLFAPIKNNKSVESSKNVSFLANYDPQNTEQQILIKQFQQINQQQSIHDFSSYKLNAKEAYNGIYDVYALRYIALDQKISNKHLAQILIHLAKHRGFKSNRKDLAPTSQNAKEKQSVNSSLQHNQKELENYRTIGEMLYVLKQNNSGTTHIKIRNSSYSSDSYHHMFHRENQDGNTIKNIMQEAETILKKQQLLGNTLITNEFIERYLKILTQQKSFDWKNNIEDKVGYCILEIQNNNTENRAPKACFSSEKFVALSFLNNIKIYDNAYNATNDSIQNSEYLEQSLLIKFSPDIRNLTINEINVIIQEAMNKKGDITFYQIRNILNLGEHEVFDNFVAYKKGEDIITAEKNTKPKQLQFKAYKELKKCLESACGINTWNNLVTNYQILDQIARICTYCKEDKKLKSELKSLFFGKDTKNYQYSQYLALVDKFPQDTKNLIIVAILNSGIQFDDNINLSLTALYKITPYLEQGYEYSEACKQAGYHHSKQSFEKLQYLPPIWGRTLQDEQKYGKAINISLDALEQEMSNPVVKRSISQVRKVVNAIIRKYGSPYQINIELARDLGNSAKKRGQIEKQQKENQENTKKSYEQFKIALDSQHTQLQYEGESNYKIKGDDGLKYKLWQEQNERCIYSGEKIHFPDLLATKNSVQVDHIIPYSRSYDNSYSNKVLCKIAHNQNKKQMTAYEYMSSYFSDSDLHKFEERCLSYYDKGSTKYKNLMRKKFDDQSSAEFIERNLNDTRYVAKFCKNYIETYLHFADYEVPSNSRLTVHCLTGRITDYLRRHWRLHNLHKEVVAEKIGEKYLASNHDKKDRDNDLHHAVDACVIAVFNNKIQQDITKFAQEQEDKGLAWRHLGHFPQPIPEFREHVKCQLKNIFVSRMPRHTIGGATHDDTIRSSKYCGDDAVILQNIKGEIENPFSTVKKPIASSGIYWDSELETIKNLCPTYEKHNRNLYNTLKDWLIKHEIIDLKGKVLEKALLQALRDDPLYAPQKDINIIDDNTEYATSHLLSNRPLIKSVRVYTTQKSGIAIRNGISDRATIIRIDIFNKNNKNYIIPVYAHDIVADQLPNADCSENFIDASYQFCFSLYKNDFVSLYDKKNAIQKVQGYYQGFDSSTNSLSIFTDDGSDKAKNPRYGIRNFKIQKYSVDVLGNITQVKKEKRLCFNKKQWNNAKLEGIEVYYQGKNSLMD